MRGVVNPNYSVKTATSAAEEQEPSSQSSSASPSTVKKSPAVAKSTKAQSKTKSKSKDSGESATTTAANKANSSAIKTKSTRSAKSDEPPTKDTAVKHSESAGSDKKQATKNVENKGGKNNVDEASGSDDENLVSEIRTQLVKKKDVRNKIQAFEGNQAASHEQVTSSTPENTDHSKSSTKDVKRAKKQTKKSKQAHTDATETSGPNNENSNNSNNVRGPVSDDLCFQNVSSTLAYLDLSIYDPIATNAAVMTLKQRQEAVKFKLYLSFLVLCCIHVLLFIAATTLYIVSNVYMIHMLNSQPKIMFYFSARF